MGIEENEYLLLHIGLSFLAKECCVVTKNLPSPLCKRVPSVYPQVPSLLKWDVIVWLLHSIIF